jgi:hypothetical protein
MNGEELVAAVREDCATELDRLGSEKAVIAATGAELERDAVLSAAAGLLDGAAATFEAWAEDTDHDAAREAFADAAGTAVDARDDLLARGEDAGTDGDRPHLFDELATLDRPPERVAAGLVAYPLVAERQFLQVINFFVNEGARAEADAARDVREGLQATPDDAAALLDDVCGSDEDWVMARKAATDAVGVAYDEYAEALQEMGLDPKPVC